ncbi:hypothetical protein [Mucilaginibacter sp.]|jgi:hypothetical protein|uniref:hypothetical protein n=1 Tax=Mucilaginibacter sp. TaxID=1882438 RepID=UPI00356674FB
MNSLLKYRARYLLIAAVMLLLAISYQLAFRHTFAALQLQGKLKGKLASSNDLSVQPGYLDRKYKNLDALTTRYRADTAVFRADVISAVAIVADQQHAWLTEVPGTDTSFNRRGLIMQKMALRGDFFSLLKVYDQLNGAAEIGLVRSVTIRAPQHANDPRGKPLEMEVYLCGIR